VQNPPLPPSPDQEIDAEIDADVIEMPGSDSVGTAGSLRWRSL
jgi:hypothetical protein